MYYNEGMRFDTTTHAQAFIDYSHAELHEGNHFYIKGYELLDTDETVEFIVITPAGLKRAHMRFSY